MVNLEIKALAAVVFALERELSKVNLIEVELLSILAFGLFELFDQSVALLIERLLNLKRFEFFLADNFSLYFVTLVKPSKRSDSNAFVGKLSMEKFDSLFHGEACPLYKCVSRSKEVNVVLVKLS